MTQKQFDLLQLDDIFSTSSTNEKYIYDIPEANEDSLSFFFPYYQQSLSPLGQFPDTKIDDESKLPAPFRTYESPTWTNWADIWNESPIELDHHTISQPELELRFQSVLFRLTLQPAYLATSVEETRSIRQGTTFVFKGHEHEDVRFVVEWLQFIHEHTAFLKIVAMTSTGNRFPYTDPDFPSFILIAPLCLVYVLPPPGLELYYAYPVDVDNDEELEEGDIEQCWACKFTF